MLEWLKGSRFATRPRTCPFSHGVATCILGVSLAIGPLMAMATTARGNEVRAGMRVIQKDRDFVLKVSKEVVERRGLIEVYVVEQVHDSWVWLDSKRGGLK